MEDKNENVETTEPVVTEPVQDEVKEEPASLKETEVVVKAETLDDPTTPTENTEPETPIEHEQPSMQMEPNAPTTEPVKKQGKAKVIGIIIAAVVVLLFVVGLLVLPSLLANKKKVVDNEITTVFSEIKKTIKEVDKNSVEYDFDRDSIGIEGTLTVSSDYKAEGIDLSKLKDYALSYQGAIDKKGNKASASLKLSGKKPILDIVAMIKGKEVYANLGDIFDKTLFTKTDEEIKDMELNTITAEDIEVILNNTENTIKNSISKDDITKEKVEKEINGKKGKYTKVSYELSVGDTSKAVLKGYLEDDKVLEILSKATTQDKKDVKKTINSMIDNMGKPSNDRIKVNLYTSGLFPKTKELELVADETTLTIDTDKDVITYSMKVDKESLGSGTYDKTKKVFTYEFKQDDYTVKAEANFKDPNKTTANVSLKADGGEVKVDLVAETKTTGKSTSNDIKVTLNYKDSSDKFKVELNSNSKMTVGAKVEDVDTKGAVAFEDITDEELQEAYSKLSEKLVDIINDIYPAYLEQFSTVEVVE